MLPPFYLFEDPQDSLDLLLILLASHKAGLVAQGFAQQANT